jgi:hypothetical protein
MNTSGLIDNRNRDLWESLKNIYEIDIQFQNRVDYLVFSQSNKAIIYVPKNKIDPAAFTHELLHIYLRTKKVFISSGLVLSIKGYPQLSRIFSDKLLEHIGNCLDHVKMLPEYLRLGFEREDFLSDYSTHKFSKEERKIIKQNYAGSSVLGKIYNSSAIDLYIGKFFAVKSCPNNTRNYTNELKELETLDSSLYQILDKFFIAWTEFDYNNDDPIFGGYHSMLFDFTDELDNWATGKKII